MNDNTCDIGLLGLGVMGKNFALNMADKGFRVAVYNRTEDKDTGIHREGGGGPPD
jgi:6-phosphogluconate dehydrogenase